jgi:4-hydroxybenzoate polyprenyltransferase
MSFTTPKASMPPPSPFAWLPQTCVPYAELTRIDQPHGILVAFFTHMLGLSYAVAMKDAPHQLPQFARTTGRLLCWTVLCRSAGCAWNDVVDQDYDRQTARCRRRPIARGALTTTDGCLTAILLVMLAFFALHGLPSGCIRLALLAVALTGIYPFAKRVSNFPQLLLGVIAGLTVPLSAYAINVDALSGLLRTPTICLMSTVVVHVVFYDVVYARQDIPDDIKSGAKSMAVLCRNHIPLLLGVLACSAVGLVAGLGGLIDAQPDFFVVALGGQLLGLGSVEVLLLQQGMEAYLKKLGGWGFMVALGSLIGAFATQI